MYIVISIHIISIHIMIPDIPDILDIIPKRLELTHGAVASWPWNQPFETRWHLGFTGDGGLSQLEPGSGRLLLRTMTRTVAYSKR